MATVQPPATPVAGHVTAVANRPVGLTAWMIRAECSCGWAGPSRDESHELTALDDAAGHLLEVQS